MPNRVLLVEDEIGLRVGLEDSLRIAGYEVETADDGEEALRRASLGGFDAILLDLILPLKDGLTVCQELRSNGIDTPVLMLTAKSQLEDRLRGFAVGADDYLIKPVEVMEMLARIRAVLHRSSSSGGDGSRPVHEFGDLRVDSRHAAVWRADARLSLSEQEYKLLQYLVTHPNETLTRQHLLKELWDSHPGGLSRTVDVHVNWLRRKIEADPKNPRWIRTVYGKGYKFVPD